MHMSGKSLLIIVVVGIVAGWPNRAGHRLWTRWRFDNRSRRRLHRRLAATAAWSARRLGHYSSDHQCHLRRFDSLADHEAGSRREQMASKNGIGTARKRDYGRFVRVTRSIEMEEDTYIRYAAVGCCFIAAAILLIVSSNSYGGKNECRNRSARSVASLFTPCDARVEVYDPFIIGTALAKQQRDSPPNAK